MVARQELGGQTVAAPVRPLKPVSEEEKRQFEDGSLHRLQRKRMAEMSLMRSPPNEDEKYIVHNLFMEAERLNNALPPSDYQWMDETTMSRTEVMQSQDRNIHNKIFGGHLMRVALELAFATSWHFGGVMPILTAVDDIHFITPVPVGSIVNFKSQVVFSSKLSSTLVIYIDAQIMDPLTGQFTTGKSNEFFFCFRVFNPNQPVRTIMPRSYADAMKMLDGRRRLVSYLPTIMHH